jgi:hypothetical protein
MQKIGANLIFHMAGSPLRQGYLILNDNKVIVDVVDTAGKFNEIHGLAFYSGVLIPAIILGQNPEPLFPIELSTNKAARILYQKGFQAADSDANSNLSVKDVFTSSKLNFQDTLSLLTIKAAGVFDLVTRLGSIEIGKSPGILHIQGFDFKNQCLLPNAQITRIV